MSTEILENGLRAIARRDCPCICCRNNAETARLTLEAHGQSQRCLGVTVGGTLPPNAVLIDSAECRTLKTADEPLFHHPV